VGPSRAGSSQPLHGPRASAVRSHLAMKTTQPQRGIPPRAVCRIL
jgi:hypothetical protein